MKTLTLTLLAMFFSATLLSKEIVLTSDNTISLYGAVSGSSVEKVTNQAIKLNSKMKSGYPIYFFLNTPGGNIQAGLELIEFLNGFNRPVHTVTLFAASMGWHITQHLGDRYIMNYGTLMSHKARGGFSGEFGGGVSQLDSRYGFWLRRIDMLDKQTVKRTKGIQTLKSYRDAYRPELWLNGQEAVVQGYADSVVSVKCDDSLLSQYHKEKIDLGFFTLTVELSDCPLRTFPSRVEANIYTNKGEMSLEDFLKKDGKFDTECESNGDRNTPPFWQTNNANEASELCSKGDDVTLSLIRNEIEKVKEYYRGSFSDRIIYSY